MKLNLLIISFFIPLLSFGAKTVNQTDSQGPHQLPEPTIQQNVFPPVLHQCKIIFSNCFSTDSPFILFVYSAPNKILLRQIPKAQWFDTEWRSSFLTDLYQRIYRKNFVAMTSPRSTLNLTEIGLVPSENPFDFLNEELSPETQEAINQLEHELSSIGNDDHLLLCPPPRPTSSFFYWRETLYNIGRILWSSFYQS